MRVLSEGLNWVALFRWWLDGYGVMVAEYGCKVAEEGVGKLMVHESFEE